MRIRFTNFWKGFDPVNNFFTEMLLNNKFEIEIENQIKTQVDIEIFSVFPTLQQKIARKFSFNKDYFKHYQLNNSKVRIWFSGENILPPHHKDFDFYLSFSEKEDAKNIYFPLWKLDLDWFNSNRINPRLGIPYNPNNLVKQRENNNKRLNRACAFINNMDPQRKKMIDTLRENIPVDVYGRSSGKIVKSKLEIAKNYRYIFCPENSLTMGYTTEKLIEAYASQSVPIYVGAFRSNHEFNLSSFLYSNSFNLNESMLYGICNMQENEWLEHYRQPLMKQMPKIDELSSLVKFIKLSIPF